MPFGSQVKLTKRKVLDRFILQAYMGIWLFASIYRLHSETTKSV